MRGFLRLLFVVAAVGLVLGLLVIAGIAGVVAWADPLAHAVVSIDGEQVSLSQLHGSTALIALVAIVGVLALVFVVPLAVVLPLLAVALALVTAVLALVGTLALVFSPLIFVVWLCWRLARPARPAPMLAR